MAKSFKKGCKKCLRACDAHIVVSLCGSGPFPKNPFTEWDTEFMYVCFNDSCPYLVRGWQVMGEQGNRGMSYRCMFNPANNRCMPIPVPSLQALKEGILE